MNSPANMLGEQGQLNEALKVLQNVLDKSKRILGEDHPDRLSALDNLTRMVGDQGQLDGVIALLEVALRRINGTRENGQVCLDGSKRGLSEIDETIQPLQQAVDSTLENTSDVIMGLNGVALLLKKRYGESNKIKDIEATIREERLVLGLFPGYLVNLERLLAELHQQIGKVDDLHKAIQFTQHAVDLASDEHPLRICLLHSLGRLTESLYQRTGQEQDLEIAIRAARVAVDSTPKDDPDRAEALGNFGLMLATLYQQKRQEKDIQEAIKAMEQAVDSTPDGSQPDRLSRVWNLRQVLTIRNRFPSNKPTSDFSEYANMVPIIGKRESRFLNRISSPLRLLRRWKYQLPDEVTAPTANVVSHGSPVTSPNSNWTGKMRTGFVLAAAKLRNPKPNSVALCQRCGGDSGYVARCVRIKSQRGFPAVEAPHPKGPFPINLNCVFCRLIQHLIPSDLSASCISVSGNGASWGATDYFNVACKVDGIHRHLGRIAAHSPALHDEKNGQGQSSLGKKEILVPNQVSHWIEKCELEHDHSREVSGSAHDELHILLVDVTAHRLVRTTTKEKFVALSYVWGGVPAFQTTTANLSALMSQDGLRPCMSQIPLTIQDAMEMVRALGEQYLWADSLCIVQDDAVEKHNQISRMDLVYGLAYLTIVAHSGEDAASPLPGVRAGTRITQEEAEIPPGALKAIQHLSPRYRQLGLKLVALKSDPFDATTRYETRGWTFQERILSKRCLFFNNHNIWFQCDSMVVHDLDESNHGGRPDIPQAQVPSIRLILPSHSSSDNHSSHRETGVEQKTFRMYAGLVEQYSRRKLSYPSDRLNAFIGVVRVLESQLSCESICGLPVRILSYALLWSVGEISTGDFQRNKEFPSWSWAGWSNQIKYSYSSFTSRLDGSPSAEFDLIKIVPKIQRLRWTVARKRKDGSINTRAPAAAEKLWNHNSYLVLHFVTHAVKACPRFCIGASHSGNEITSRSRPVGRCGYFWDTPANRGHIDDLTDDHEFIILSRLRYLDKTKVPSYIIMLVRWSGTQAERVAIGSMDEDYWLLAEPVLKEITLI